MADPHIARKPLAESVRRLILREMDDMCCRPASEDAVHSLRVSGKRIRAWLRIIRKAMGDKVWRREDTAMRDLGRLFSGRRNSGVLIATLDGLEKGGAAHFSREKTLPLRAALEAEAEFAEAAHPMQEEVRNVLFPARRRLESLRLGPAHLERVFRREWRQARQAHASAVKSRETETLHEWRKRAKALLYELEAVKDIWPHRIKRWIKRLKAQGDLLGQDHDMAMLAEKLDDEVRRKIIATRRKDLQDRAFAIGRSFYRPKPKKIARALKARWKRWRNTSP